MSEIVVFKKDIYGKSDSGAGALESLHVSFGSEESDFAVDTVEGLQTFEALDGVMEGGVEGINLKASVSADLGSSPTFLGVPIDFKEMVRGAVSELEAGVELGKGLGVLGGFNDEVLSLMQVSYLNTTIRKVRGSCR